MGPHTSCYEAEQPDALPEPWQGVSVLADHTGGSCRPAETCRLERVCADAVVSSLRGAASPGSVMLPCIHCRVQLSCHVTWQMPIAHAQRIMHAAISSPWAAMWFEPAASHHVCLAQDFSASSILLEGFCRTPLKLKRLFAPFVLMLMLLRDLLLGCQPGLTWC